MPVDSSIAVCTELQLRGWTFLQRQELPALDFEGLSTESNIKKLETILWHTPMTKGEGVCQTSVSLSEEIQDLKEQLANLNQVLMEQIRVIMDTLSALKP